MAIESHPVWPFEPNWTSSVGESLEWLTDIMQSPRGSEQRRTMRFFPRKTLDFSIAVEGDERSFLDNLLTAYGSRDWYLPIWYDQTLSTAPSSSTVIPCNPSPDIAVGSVIFIGGDTVYDYQIAEVNAVNPTSITVVDALDSNVPTGTRIYPMTVGRLNEMPSITAMTDGFETAEPQFTIVAKPSGIVVSVTDALLDDYGDFRVLTRAEEWSKSRKRGQQRLFDEMEHDTGNAVRVDTANRPFPTQQHHWVLDGPEDHRRFYALLQHLRGRAIPLWMPTWMDDMRMDSGAIASDSVIHVKRFGYTLAGGPRPEREDIMIELVDGSRLYRRITDSAIAGDTEVLLLDAPLGIDMTPASVLRICFMSLMRLDHDAIEIDHLTDMEGVSEVMMTFRSAPDTRKPDPAF